MAPDATVLAVGDHDVSSWDLAGRPYALVRDGVTHRRGLDGGVLAKGRHWSGDVATPFRRRLDATEAREVVESARREAEAALAALPADAPAEAAERLRTVVASDTPALARDAARFREIYSPLGILPPDQYLAIVVQATDGCSWNQCRFCSLYAGVSFRVRGEAEFRAHLHAVRDYLGPALPLRRSVFVGAANALCVARARLEPLLRSVGRCSRSSTPRCRPGTRAVLTGGRCSRGHHAPLSTPGPATKRKEVDEWRAAESTRPAAGLRRPRARPGLLGVPRQARSDRRTRSRWSESLHAGIAASVIVWPRRRRALRRGPRRPRRTTARADAAPRRRPTSLRPARPQPRLRARGQRSGRQLLGFAAQQRPRRPRPAGPKVARYDLDEFVY